MAFLFEARGACAVLEAGRDLGVLDRLRTGRVTASGLAEQCRITPRAAETLLTALHKLGLAEPTEAGGYGPGRLRIEELSAVLATWDSLADGLRDSGRGNWPDYATTVRGLAVMNSSAAARAAHWLADTGPRVLELGAGAAAWSLALVAADPRREVTALDLEPVLATAREAVAAAGQCERYQFLGADLFEVDLPEGGFDLVIAGHMCHLFDDADNRRLLARAASWLRPRGTVVLIDLLPSDVLPRERMTAVYEVGLVRRRPAGRVHAWHDYLEWLDAAGFQRAERLEVPLGSGAVSLIRASTGTS